MDQFEDIANRDIIDIQITILSFLHLCELLFGEFKAYNKDDVKNEIRANIDKLLEFTSKYGMKMLHIRVLFLKANFESIADTDRLDDTVKSLNVQIGSIEEETLYDRYHAELQELQDNVSVNLVERSSTLEKLQQSNINLYIKHAMRVAIMEPRELNMKIP